MTFGFEAGVGFFVALMLCGLIVTYIVEVGLLVLAAGAAILLLALAAACGPGPAWIGDGMTLAIVSFIALSLIVWGLNAAGLPHAAGRALRRLRA